MSDTNINSKLSKYLKQYLKLYLLWTLMYAAVESLFLSGIEAKYLFYTGKEDRLFSAFELAPKMFVKGFKDS